MPYLFAVLLSCLLLSACGSTPPSQFYLITPMPLVDDSAPKSAQTSIENVGLGLGPLRFPDYLSRNSIVRYEDESRVSIAETRRWAEPLEFNFSRVLAENLSRLLASDRVLRYPWPAWRKPEYQLVMDVLRFDYNGNNEVELIVQWAILKTDTKKILLEKRSHFSQAASEDFDSIVKAHSQALAEFSQAVFVAVASLN